MSRTAEHGFPRWYTVGSAETRDPTQLKALINTQTSLDLNRYDSFDSPRGTSYQVPTGKTFYITKLQGSIMQAAGADVGIEVGYGDTHVEDSVAAPTNSTPVYLIKFYTINGVQVDLDVWIPIPAGKFPYIYLMNNVGNFEAMGIEV